MLGTVRQRRRPVAQTIVEQDLARILPPEREDLTGANGGDYGLCIMGEHTVAAVATARTPQRRGKGKVVNEVQQALNDAQGAVNAAQDALQAAQDAHNRAQDAVQRAQDAYNRQHGRGGRADYRAAESEELARRLRSGMISPNSAARDLLRIREGLLSRLP